MNQDWRSNLLELRPDEAAIVSVGNVLKGDDGIGPAVARALRGARQWRVFDCGTVPENWTGPLVRCEPKWLLVVDAVDTGASPGEITWLAPDDLDAGAGSTHAMSLAFFIGNVTERTGAQAAILAVQPKAVSFGTGLSDPAREAVATIVEALTSLVADSPDGANDPNGGES